MARLANYILVTLTISVFYLAFSDAMKTNKIYKSDEDYIEKKKLANYDPDVDLDTPSIISRHNYPAEGHTVKTQDGYLLTIHRIPYSQKSARKSNKPVVLIQHGLLCSSVHWVIPKPEKGLPYILADKGYDVWLGNVRGNSYSRAHVSLSPSDAKFWDFSFDEMGYYDLPAMIDYILNKTGQSQLYYIGHSMGTTMGYVLTSSRKEYNSKIRAMISLSPGAFFSHIKSPLRLLNHAPSLILEEFDRWLGHGELLQNNKVVKYLTDITCETSLFQEEICKNMLFLFFGFDSDQFNMTLLPVILGHSPEGTSVRTVLHYLQLIKSGKFEPYRCNRWIGYKCYTSPPVSKYQLDEIKTPVSLHYAENDALADTGDVALLYSELKNVIGYYKVPFSNFNHIDFLWGIDAPALVYNAVIEILNKSDLSSIKSPSENNRLSEKISFFDDWIDLS